MKLPSIQQIINEGRQTFRRFPLVLSVAAVGTVAALIIVDHEGPGEPSVLFQVLLAAGLGVSLLIGLALMAEKRGWSRSTATAAQGIGLLLLVGYALTVPSDLLRAPQIYVNRFCLLMVAVHMFTAVAPYFAKGELNGFWQYNKTIFFRLLVSALFSAVLFIGLAIALAALNNLFGVTVPARRYAELWITIGGLFNTWFFLAGIPTDLTGLDHSREYPKGLKVFAQYILLSLVLVYMVILYAYLGKIVIEWNWPKGWVSRLILGFTSTGIFSFLLLYPIRDLTENAWIKRAWRWFYFVILPLVVVLFLAASQRITQYGITEGRYLLLVCGGWLALTALYFTFSRAKSIKFIPITLGAISLIIAFGPWGAFSVAEKSQVDRLASLLTGQEILVNSHVQKAPSAVPPEEASQISAIFDYLREQHGYEAVQPWFTESLRQDSSGSGSRYKSAEKVVAIIGVEYIRTWESKDFRWFNATVDPNHSASLAGYDRMLPNQGLPGVQEPHDFPDENVSFRCSKTLDTFTFVIMENGHGVDSLQLNLLQFANHLREHRSARQEFMLPLDSLSVSAESEGLKVRVAFDYLNASLQDNKVESISGIADIWYTINRPKK